MIPTDMNGKPSSQIIRNSKMHYAWWLAHLSLLQMSEAQMNESLCLHCEFWILCSCYKREN